jgi:hypothetical protein
LIVVAVAEIAIIMANANYIKEALKCPSLKSPRVLAEAAEARADFELQEISKRNTTDSNCYCSYSTICFGFLSPRHP